MIHSEHLESAMKLSRSVVAVLILLAGGVAQSRAGILYGSEIANDVLLTINTSTGAPTFVGFLGFEFVDGLAFDPSTNTLYGSEILSDVLLTINTSTGAATSVGALGFGNVRGLAFDSNTNTLYGADATTHELLTINTSTGAATSVGALGPSGLNGLAFDPNTNTLYGVDFSHVLLTINTSTGAGTSVGALGFDAVAGLAFDPNTNTLFGTDLITKELLTINTSTGAATSVGALGPRNVEGLAFTPEPSTVILAALGLVGLATFGWRRRRVASAKADCVGTHPPYQRPRDFSLEARLMQITISRATVLCTLLSASMPLSAACGGLIIQPVAVSSPQGSSVGRPLSQLIDQSGLSVNYVSGVTDFASYTATATHLFSNSTSGQTATAFGTTSPQQLTFDLGSLAPLNGIAVWNFAGTTAITEFELFTDNDSDFANGTTSQLGGTFTLNLVVDPNPAQTFSFAQSLSRFVHLNITNIADPNPLSTTNNPLTGEVAFSAIPEPSSIGLAIIGLIGLLAWGWRRRRK